MEYFVEKSVMILNKYFLKASLAITITEHLHPCSLCASCGWWFLNSQGGLNWYQYTCPPTPTDMEHLAEDPGMPWPYFEKLYKLILVCAHVWEPLIQPTGQGNWNLKKGWAKKILTAVRNEVLSLPSGCFGLSTGNEWFTNRCDCLRLLIPHRVIGKTGTPI